MATLLDRVAAHLTAERIPFALVGASAMAAHGVSRATQDMDLLVTLERALDESLWDALAHGGDDGDGDLDVDVRIGDDDDPLCGVIRLRDARGDALDVVVGRGAWQAALIERADPVRIDDAAVPVVTAADLILLKLYAGGPQDRWDIEQLLAATSPGLHEQVESHLHELPERCAYSWSQLSRSASSA